MIERGRFLLAQHQASETQREQQQGFGKPIISSEMNGTRFVAVGKTLRYSSKWKTVHDFLGDYIRAVLGTDWGNAELAKPLEQRHPILIWYHHLCLLQLKFITESALQDPLIVQVADLIEESSIRGEIPASSALQDVLNPLSPILAGLIAHLFELTLQEDIASTTRRLIQLGHDVINRSRHEDDQASAAPRAAAPGARAVQLG